MKVFITTLMWGIGRCGAVPLMLQKYHVFLVLSRQNRACVLSTPIFSDLQAFNYPHTVKKAGEFTSLLLPQISSPVIGCLLTDLGKSKAKPYSAGNIPENNHHELKLCTLKKRTFRHEVLWCSWLYPHGTQ